MRARSSARMRAVNGTLRQWSSTLAQRLRTPGRWGLGAFVTYLTAQGSMPADLLDRLSILNDHRKTLYHYGHSETDTALQARLGRHLDKVGESTIRKSFKEAYGHEGDNKEVWRYAMDSVLREDALAALTTALMLRSWLAR